MYRGYLLMVSPVGVQVWNLSGTDCICTEPDEAAARAVIDGWLSAK